MTPLFVLTAALSSPAFAGEADDILAKLDARMNNYTDQTISWEVKNMPPGAKQASTMAFNTVVKGGKTFSEFTAPGDIKGMRTLTTSPTQIWVWLPEFSKIRRVASHALDQGFMGTTLNQQDMGTLAYAPLYAPSIKAQDDTSWTLTLTTRDEKQTAYSTLEMVVSKEFHQPTVIRYIGDDGVVRTQERIGYTCLSDDYCTFKTLKMTDHTTGDAWTELTCLDRKMNTGISDDIFTPRTLQLGL